MINRYAGEIHINPISQLRNGDFNNDGRIQNVDATLREAVEFNQRIGFKLQQLKAWLHTNKSGLLQLHFADGGYISLSGLTDSQLKELESKGLIQLHDFATDKNWVKKFGHHFGLIWEDGQAIEI
jgi:type I site-specific restriction endonuclease